MKLTAPLPSPLDLSVFVSLLSKNVAVLNVRVRQNLFTSQPRDALVRATGGDSGGGGGGGEGGILTR